MEVKEVKRSEILNAALSKKLKVKDEKMVRQGSHLRLDVALLSSLVIFGMIETI